ncbi:MAG TPA: class I SAM-dependent methyltransferase [Spirochaetota bacterium]|nr:class I SAM-dependent methyltransferase [Spirochaetota bacterium]HPI88370.1 class I SAM-dependent methyltransferase [Spirochaetota bacterium]HPR46772.1 class I SAM-dependent methyltransferase [Spirochaetota bacterium]
MFSIEEIERTYEKVHDLLITRHIIKTYSINKSDIRDVALNALDLSGKLKILELGCGYGFFIEKLAGRIHPDAVIIGIDLVEKNREPFLNSVAASGYKGEFIRGNASLINSMTNISFDLIIASYSLYFFPDLVDDISRLLSDDGIFIVLTHSKNSLQEALNFLPQCIQAIGFDLPHELMINRLFSSFSSENGRKKLGNHFNMIEKINYNNTLVFGIENIDDCIYYLVKKRNLIYKEILDIDHEVVVKLESLLAQRIYSHVATHGNISLNKDDAVFRCMMPKH